MHLRGKKRFLLGRAFLDDLAGPNWLGDPSERPVPDPPGDYYVLDQEQLNAYRAFRRRLDGEA
jgi:hypothetical protein